MKKIAKVTKVKSDEFNDTITTAIVFMVIAVVAICAAYFLGWL